MLQEKEMTTLNPSVAADGEQSLTNHNNSIADDAPSVNEDSVNLENDEQYDFEAEQREMWKHMDPNYLKTVSMPELYDTVYPSRPPVIDGLLYPGTYILAGAPKLGKSFLMAQLAYHVSAGLPLWGYNVHKGSVLYLALEDDYGRLQKRLYQMFGVKTSANLYLGTEAHILGILNTRKDKWGGAPIENRARFTVEICRAIKRACGQNFPIEVRISGSECYEGGFDIENGIAFARQLEGVCDLIHVSAGNHEVDEVFGVTHPSMFLGEGPNVRYAAEIKKHVKTPVATVGAIGEPVMMEEIIASGQADVVEMPGRCWPTPTCPSRPAWAGRRRSSPACGA